LYDQISILKDVKIMQEDRKSLRIINSVAPIRICDSGGRTDTRLLEVAIEKMGIPEDFSFEVNIFSEAPAGASTGTSAEVTVALIGGLDSLTTGRLTPHETAYMAHSIETDMLKQQCGIQDQLCSAYGGINHIEMFKQPHAAVSPIFVPNSIQ
jgi:D-glycero-alpha-D-manno-heptose-7-phosphate kinase